MKSTLTPLNYLLLALLDRKPQSGYGLCRMIEAMPIGAVSASPGSIYPSLSKLMDSGHLLAEAYGGTVKRRKRYSLSAAGRRALKKWLRAPISASTAIRSPEILFIKLSFADPDSAWMVTQMKTLSTDLGRRLDELQTYRAAGLHDMAAGGQQALDLSIQLVQLLHTWTDSFGET
ncbi:MAG: PadR family transcriptional regulator [Pseudomonadota bacterium]